MDQAKPVGRIDVISDAICPWCYIGKRHLESALVILGKQGLHFTCLLYTSPSPRDS